MPVAFEGHGSVASDDEDLFRIPSSHFRDAVPASEGSLEEDGERDNDAKPEESKAKPGVTWGILKKAAIMNRDVVPNAVDPWGTKISPEEKLQEEQNRLEELYESGYFLQGIDNIENGNLEPIDRKSLKQICCHFSDDGNDNARVLHLIVLMQRHMFPACTDEEVLALLGPALPGRMPSAEEHERIKLVVNHSDLYKFFMGPPGQEFSKLRLKHLELLITRSFFEERVEKEVTRNDAFLTLPFSMVYLSCFITLVFIHLRIYDRHLKEHALEQWVNGRNPLTELQINVEDIDTFWVWLLGDGLAGIFSSGVNNPTTGYRQYWLSNTNALIGDASLGCSKFDGTEEKVWLTHSETAQAYLANHALDYLGAARAAGAYLVSNGWASREIEHMKLVFGTYDERSAMFALVEVNVAFTVTGWVKARVNAEALFLKPYDFSDAPAGLLLAVDFLFIGLLLNMFYNESKDMCGALATNFKEFLDYWAFWNVVDWICIVLGLLLALLWYLTMIAMESDCTKILTDYKLTHDVMSLDTAQIEEIIESLRTLSHMFFFLQCTITLNILSIVSKFFKAFSSNARVRLVTDTFAEAAEELGHFFVIFMTVFLPFMVIGHVLFGTDISDFSTLFSSITVGISILMGDCDWYNEITADNMNPLPSGTSKLVLFVWFCVFNFLVLLVMLNMLLAVVLQHYTCVAEQVVESDPSLWQQMMNYITFRRETRGFMTLEDILGGLGNDADPAHPSDEVTEESLQEYFPKIGPAQAKWLMEWLQSGSEMQADRPIEDQESTDVQVSTKLENLKTMFEDLEEVYASTGALQNSGNDEQDVEMAGIRQYLRVLMDGVGAMQREQFRLAKQVEKLSTFCRGPASANGSKKEGATATSKQSPAIATKVPKKKSRGREERGTILEIDEIDATLGDPLHAQQQQEKPSNQSMDGVDAYE